MEQLVAGPSHACGITTSGQALCWGSGTFGQLSVPSATPFSSLAIGARHTCGLTTAGVVLCWGGDDYRQSTVPPSLGGAVFEAVQCGDYHTCAITASQVDPGGMCPTNKR